MTAPVPSPAAGVPSGGTDARRRLDLSDPAVREMAELNHEPREVWTVGGDLARVSCRCCGHKWPCDTVVELRRLRAVCSECRTDPCYCDVEVDQ